MKNIFIAIIVSLLLISCGSNKVGVSSSNNDIFTAKVNGLGCQYCALGLDKKFKEWDSVSSLKIDIEKGILTFKYPTNKSLTLEQVASQVKKAGYTPVRVSVERANGKKEHWKDVETSSTAGLETSNFYVGGNCGMCKERIETAAKSVDGVKSASWNETSEILTVHFEKAKTQQRKIEEAIAKIGHDTANVKADDDTYNNLHGCCKYERK